MQVLVPERWGFKATAAVRDSSANITACWEITVWTNENCQIKHRRREGSVSWYEFLKKSSQFRLECFRIKCRDSWWTKSVLLLNLRKICLKRLQNGGKNPNPNTHKQTTGRLQNWDGEEEKEATLQQTLHIPSLTHEEATGSSRKGSSPTEKEQRSGCGSTALMFGLQEHKERPQGNWESSEQGPRWQETRAAK